MLVASGWEGVATGWEVVLMCMDIGYCMLIRVYNDVILGLTSHWLWTCMDELLVSH